MTHIKDYALSKLKHTLADLGTLPNLPTAVRPNECSVRGYNAWWSQSLWLLHFALIFLSWCYYDDLALLCIPDPVPFSLRNYGQAFGDVVSNPGAPGAFDILLGSNLQFSTPVQRHAYRYGNLNLWTPTVHVPCTLFGVFVSCQGYIKRGCLTRIAKYTTHSGFYEWCRTCTRDPTLNARFWGGLIC
jgi:hypothetical protein